MTPTILGACARFKKISIPVGKAQGKFFEDRVEECLQAEGFVASTIVLTAEEKEAFKRHERIERLKAGEYIVQPTGGNNRPDFIVFDGVLQKGVEAKSSVGLTPMYNSGFPSKNTIYVIGTSKQIGSQVTVIDGGQILPPEIKAMINEATAAAKVIDAQVNAKIDQLTPEQNPFGIRVYTRLQATHVGGKEVNSYFTPRVGAMEDKLVLDLTTESSKKLVLV